MTAIQLFYSRNSRTLAKTATYYVMHISGAGGGVCGDRQLDHRHCFEFTLKPTVQAFAFSHMKRFGNGFALNISELRPA